MRFFGAGGKMGFGRTYPKIQVTDNLILYLDSGDPRSEIEKEPRTTWKDLSGLGNNATWQRSGGYSYGTHDLNNAKNSVFFPGSFNDQYFLVTNNGSFSTNKGTFSSWNYSGFSFPLRIAGQSAIWEYGRTGTGISYDLGGTNQIFNYSLSSLQSRWSHICVTWNSPTNTSKLYINGSLVVTGTSIGSSSGNLNIGRSPGNINEEYNGSMSQVLFYNRDISADEVLDNYNTFKHLHQ